MNYEDTTTWSLEKLRRKCDQAWDMAGLARQDHDEKDEKRHTDAARHYEELIAEREA